MQDMNESNPRVTTNAVAADVVPVEPHANALAVLQPDALTKLGLSAEDVPAIHELATSIQIDNPLSVSQFGRDVGDHASKYTDQLLSEVRNHDLDEAGQKLTQVVTLAQSVNMNALTKRRSKLPVVGRFIDRVRLRAQHFHGQFEATKDQIENLVQEVDTTQQGLQQRNAMLEQGFEAVREEYRLLGLHIAAGRMRLAEIRAQADELRGRAENPMDVQRVADLDTLSNNLDIRIGNFVALQQSAFQTLPQIRVVQASNSVLVDKFHTIREVTVPAWKRQFMLCLSLNEQRNAVEMADAIDHVTQDLLTGNAKLLRHNATEAAQANQRLVIDVSTLETVQGELIGTVQDVIRIQREGVQARQQAALHIESMRRDFQARLQAPTEPSQNRLMQ